MREPVPGVYASLDELVRLQWKARGFSFRTRQQVHSLLAGRHGSRMRGRGLDFEEIRDYLPGDDIRTIDWRVTARTTKPHVRVYTEERDRPLVVLVDQRQSMFFGSRRAMKSVTALEVAALVAWRALQQGDRVGGWVFDDTKAAEVRPHRSRRAVIALFERLLERNHALAVGSAPSNPGMLDHMLDQVQRRKLHDHIILVISDFDGISEQTRRALLLLRQHNTVVAVPVLDPMATKLPDRGRFVVSNGELQVELDLGAGRVRENVQAYSGKRLDTVLAWQREIRVPVLPVSTAEEPAGQLQRLIGARSRPGAR